MAESRHMQDKPVLIALVQLPPPYHGVTVANERLLHSGMLAEDFDVRAIPIRVAESINDLGKLSLKKLWRSIRPIAKLWRALRKADLVYYTPGGQGLPLLRDALMMFICRLRQVPYALHMHSGAIGFNERNEPLPRYLDAALRSFMPRASRIIFLGDSVRPNYSSYMRSGQPYTSVGNGVELPPVHKPLPGGPLRLCFLNNLIRIKGVMHAMRCLALVPDAHMDVVGAFSEPDYERMVRNEITMLGIQDRVHFHGAHFGDASWTKLSDCHCLLYTSDWQEGFPLVWLEAMARGKVVVTSRIGVADDVIGRIDPKLILPKADPEAMARVVRELQDNRAELVRLSNIGLDLVAREFTVESWSRRVAGALRQCIPRAGRRHGENAADKTTTENARDTAHDAFNG